MSLEGWASACPQWSATNARVDFCGGIRGDFNGLAGMSMPRVYRNRASTVARLRRPGRQQGMGLATALFVITVMALLALLINQLVTTNAQTTQEEVQLLRAFYAAQSGVEFGLNQALPPDGSATACPTATNTTLTLTPPVMDVAGLQQCSVSLQCATVIVASKPYYTLTSEGSCGGVSRTIQVRAQ